MNIGPVTLKTTPSLHNWQNFAHEGRRPHTARRMGRSPIPRGLCLRGHRGSTAKAPFVKVTQAKPHLTLLLEQKGLFSNKTMIKKLGHLKKNLFLNKLEL